MNSKRKTFREQMSADLIRCLESISVKKHIYTGHVLFRDGEPADFLFLVDSGLLKVSKITSDGKELTLQIIGKGDLAGAGGLFEKDPVYQTTGTMTESGDVWVIPRTGLEKILVGNGEFCGEFLRWLGQMNRFMESRFRDLLLHGKTGALYSTLIRMSNSYGKEHPNGILIDLPMTNRELAQFIGLTRESVNRMLSELKKLDIIDLLPHGYIVIKDLHYLKKAICCDDCSPDICHM